jgi:excisionase family DNA binding protein
LASKASVCKAEVGNPVKQVAFQLSIKRDTVYKWINHKNMPAHKVGSLWKFKRDEIDEWVRSGKAQDSSRTTNPR